MTRSGTKSSPAQQKNPIKQKNPVKQKTGTGSSTSRTGDSASREPLGDCGDKKIRCKSLVIDGIKYKTQTNKKFENRVKYTAPDQLKIFSVIPGTVLKILTSEGEVIRAGDSMIILESMKMKNKILFPRDGTVKKIRVKEGDKIPKGHLMVELED